MVIQFKPTPELLQRSFNQSWAYIFRSAEADKLDKNLTYGLSWNLINPGMVLAVAYMYFIIGKENGLIADYILGNPELCKKFIVTEIGPCATRNIDTGYLLKRLRNAIAHGNVAYSDENESRIDPLDKYRYFSFHDINPRNNRDYITIKISVPTFGNIIEDIGKNCFEEKK